MCILMHTRLRKERVRILKGSKEELLEKRISAAFFPHGLGHHLGMDTYDAGGNPNYADKDSMFRYLRVRHVFWDNLLKACSTSSDGCPEEICQQNV
jgi:hypothetical protein